MAKKRFVQGMVLKLGLAIRITWESLLKPIVDAVGLEEDPVV